MMHRKPVRPMVWCRVDVEQGMLRGGRGPSKDITDVWGKATNYHFGVIAFAGKAKNLMGDTSFTQDATKLQGAVEVDEGIKDVLSFTQPATITGVTIKNISAVSGTGPGYLKFIAGPPPRLAWKDPDDTSPGGDFGDPVDITAPTNEGYKLLSCRKSAAGGPRCAPESAERYATVLVDGAATYPPKDLVDTVVVSSAMRNCLRFRVRNVTLMQTGVHRVLKTSGNNTIKVYFAEAPRFAKEGHGIFRIREIPFNYHKTPPPETRTPHDAEITIADDDFSIKE